MVRQGLDADAPYADAVLHADGLISLQYRLVKGGETQEIKSPIKGPDRPSRPDRRRVLAVRVA